MPFGTRSTPKSFVVLGRKIGADMNSTSAQAINILSQKYVIRRIVFTNASTSLTTAAGGVYADSGGSTALINSAQAYTSLNTSSKYIDGTPASAALTTVRTETQIFLKLTTPQGAAATCDVYVIGDKLD